MRRKSIGHGALERHKLILKSCSNEFVLAALACIPFCGARFARSTYADNTQIIKPKYQAQDYLPCLILRLIARPSWLEVSYCQPIPQIIARRFNRAGKSQISIFNDQNLNYRCLASLRNPLSLQWWYDSQSLLWEDQLIGFSNLSYWDLFVICLLVLGIFIK